MKIVKIKYTYRKNVLRRHPDITSHIFKLCQSATSDLREQAALVSVCNSNAQNSCCQVAYNALNYMYTIHNLGAMDYNDYIY